MSSPAAASARQPPNAANEEVDAEMEDVTHDTTAPNNSSSRTEAEEQTNTLPQMPEQNSSAPPPTRKDITLREFLGKMDDYAPIIPDAVTAHYLTLAGLPPPSLSDPTGATTNTMPLPLARLLALATQKFVADIAADAYQYSRIRASNTAAGSNAIGVALPGQAVPGAGGVGAGGGAGGAGGAKGQASQLGIQRAGFGGGGQGGSAQGKTVLTMEDLGMAVQEYGINVKRGEFYR